MNKAFITTVFLAVFTAHISSAQNYGYRLAAEVQTQGPENLPELTWQQGTTPLISVEPLQRGRPIAADTNTTVRMIIGPTATGTYYAVATNVTATGNVYSVQWPTVGTNTAGDAWWYTIYFESGGYRYWTGNGDLYIEETTSTAEDGLVWQDITTSAVDFANILGEPTNNAALTSWGNELIGAANVGTWSGYAATQALNMATFDIDNAGDIEADSITADTSAGVVIKNLGGDAVATFGAGAGTGTTIAGGLNIGGVISGNGSGVTNVAESDPVWLSDKPDYATLTALSGYVATTGGAVNGRFDVGSGANGLVLQATMDANGESIVNVQEINGVEPASWLTSENNYSAGDVLPAVYGGAVTGLNASALSSGTVSQDRMPTTWYPTYTQTVSGTATFEITNGALQLWNVNSAVTNFVWIIPETNGVTPLSIIFNGANTNSITANGITVAGSATTWTNPLFRLVGSYYRDTATGGKVWPTVE